MFCGWCFDWWNYANPFCPLCAKPSRVVFDGPKSELDARVSDIVGAANKKTRDRGSSALVSLATKRSRKEEEDDEEDDEEEKEHRKK